MGGSYGLIEKLWVQFVLTAGPVYTEVAWTRDEVLLGSVGFRNHSSHSWFILLFCIWSIIVTGMLPRILSRVVSCAKAHHFYSLEFEERGESLWAFMRTWEKGTFQRAAVAVTDRFAVDATHKLSVLGSAVAAVGGLASLVAVFVGSHVLADTYGEYLGSGYNHKLVEYPVFDLRLLKRCLQKVSSSVFGYLLYDGNYCHAFEGAEHRDWMMSRSSLSRAIIIRRAVNAVACWGLQQHRGSVAFHRGQHQGNW